MIGLTAWTWSSEVDIGCLDIVAASFPSNLLAIPLGRHGTARMLNISSLLLGLSDAVDDCVGSTSGASNDTSYSTNPSGGSAHVDRDSDRDRSEWCRAELDQSNKRSSADNGLSECNHVFCMWEVC